MKKSSNENIKNERQAVKEFDLAWKEFFKNKPSPKNDKEEKKQLETFYHWYNYVRKQSDTGKTPSQMFEESYGRKSTNNFDEKSRMLNFEWDEDYKEPHELLQEADDLIIKGKYEKALKCVDSVLEMINDDEEALLMKSEILNDLGKYAEAEQILSKIDKKENMKAYASFYRAQRCMYEGNFAKAIKLMKEAYEQEPNNFDFIIGVANYLYIENDKYYDEYLEKARQIDKKRTEKFLKKFWLEPKEIMNSPFLAAVLECIDKLMNENKPDEAEKNLSLLLIHERFLDKGIIKVIRGLQIESFLMQKKFEEALIKIDELIKIDKNNPHAYFYKSQIFYEHSKLNDALKEINRCLEIAEKGIPHPDFYMMKAMILKRQDNDEYIYYETKAKELMKGREVFDEAFKEFMDEES